MEQRYLIFFFIFQSSVICYKFLNKNDYESGVLSEALDQIIKASYEEFAGTISITTRKYQKITEKSLLNDVLTDFLMTVEPRIKVRFVNSNFIDTNKYRYNVIFAKDFETLR